MSDSACAYSELWSILIPLALGTFTHRSGGREGCTGLIPARGWVEEQEGYPASAGPLDPIPLRFSPTGEVPLPNAPPLTVTESLPRSPCVGGRRERGAWRRN